MRWGNSSLDQTIETKATVQRNRMKECFTCVVDPGPFSAGCEITLSCKAGLLTRSGFDAFPVIHQWLRLSIPRVPVSGQELTAAGTVADFHGIPF